MQCVICLTTADNNSAHTPTLSNKQPEKTGLWQFLTTWIFNPYKVGKDPD
jgi:hypothetical protein